jgi:hypothetical protein
MMGSSIRQVHMPDETSEYGIRFVRQPLNEEKESVTEELKRAAKKFKKYKARLVANGSRQPWSTYTETSSPTAGEFS